jgi:hypothetical protein
MPHPEVVIPPERMTGKIRVRIDQVNRDLAVIDPTGKKSDVDQIEASYRRKPRMRYAAMRARMEASAFVIATGGTYKMAGSYAGVSPRQIKKYMADPDFRARVDELRELLAGKIQGKILKEFNRRVTGDHIQRMDTMDLSRIYDRVTGGGKGMKLNIGEVNIGNKYEQVLNEIFSAVPDDDGEDFPSYGDPSLIIPGTSTPVEG